MTFKNILSLLLAILALTSCEKTKAPPEKPAVEVRSYKVSKQTIPANFNFLGFAQSSHPVEMRARVEGYLQKIAYTEGGLVKEGELLFQLDPQQFEAQVEQAKGEVLKQKALLENATLTVNRLKPLYEQKAASKKDLDNAIAQQLSGEANLQSAQAQLLVAELNLGYTTIVSPINGLADKSKYREGALITPGNDGLLTTVNVLDPIWVYFTVADADILRISQESLDQSLILPEQDQYEVEALLGDGSTFKYKGKVDFNSPVYDQNTGTMLVRAVFNNPIEEQIRGIRLHPGQFVRVKVIGAKRPNAIIIPKRAALQKKGGLFVYLIRDNKVSTQDISSTEWYEKDYMIVTNGLEEGDEIVADGTNKVRPGSTVKVIGLWKPTEDAKHKKSTTRKTTQDKEYSR